MMALAHKMMGSGINQLAVASLFDVGPGLTATGTNQATALQLTNADNEFTTVAAGTGAILYAGSPGDEQSVYNGGANILRIYPDSGAKINSLPANQAVLIPINTAAIFKRMTATRWAGVISQ